MATYYSVDDVLAYMEIPLPDEDDISEDGFDGYIDQEEEEDANEGSEGEDSGDEELDGDEFDGDGEREGIPQFVGQDMTNKSPLEFLQLFITEEILQHIVQQTNLFAEQYIATHDVTPWSHVQQWHRSTHDVEELKRFLALVIVMGLVSYPSIEDSWVTSWPFATNTFSSVMPRDRFSLLLRFLHLSDSTKYVPKGQPGHDPLFKL